ncbi:MAG: hypothetical protein AB1560_08315 [Pseudomonadota bacterium]
MEPVNDFPATAAGRCGKRHESASHNAIFLFFRRAKNKKAGPKAGLKTIQQLKKSNLISFPERQEPGPEQPRQPGPRERLHQPVWRHPSPGPQEPEPPSGRQEPSPEPRPFSRKQQPRSWPGGRPSESSTFSC